MKPHLKLLLIVASITCNLQLATGSCYAQVPAIQWQKSYGGTTNDEAAFSISQTTDGGYIIAGWSASTNGEVTGNHGGVSDYWIVKTDSTGTLQWEKCLGGGGRDEATSVQQTKDGGYIVAGSSNSTDGDVTGNHGNDDYWVVKLNNVGAIQWEKSYGGLYDDDATSILQTTDGGYIIAGGTLSDNGDVTGNHGNSDCWIVKIDSVGVIQWQKAYGGTASDGAECIRQTKDGGYIVAGWSQSNNGDVSGNHGNNDYWVFKLNNTGVMQWQKCYGGAYDDVAASIEQTADGGYIMTGTADSTSGDVTGNHGVADYWVVKTDSIGNIQWEKSLGGSDDDQSASVQQTTDGGYIVAGWSFSNNGNVTGHHGIFGPNGPSDYWIVKLDCSGNIKWEQSFGGSNDDNPSAVILTKDGGYMVAGSSLSSDGDVTGAGGFWIMKLAPEKPDIVPAISISANPTGAVCAGTPVTFTALPVNGFTPSYQWKVNGVNTGTNSNTFVSDTLNNNDTITCVLASTTSCGAPLPLVTSNAVIMGINEMPVAGTITSLKDTLCSGSVMHLTLNGNSGIAQWQSSDTISTGFSNITGATVNTYNSIIPRTTYYRVVANNGNCADTSAVFTETIVPSPVAAFTYLVSGAKISFNSGTTTGADFYSWNFGDSTSSTDVNPAHIYSTSDTFHVCLTVRNNSNCDFTLCEDVTVLLTDISNITNENGISIYPNPANDAITIKKYSSQDILYTITDIAGRTIISGNLNSPVNIINIASLAAGVYLLQTGGEYKQTVKIIKD